MQSRLPTGWTPCSPVSQGPGCPVSEQSRVAATAVSSGREARGWNFRRPCGPLGGVLSFAAGLHALSRPLQCIQSTGDRTYRSARLLDVEARTHEREGSQPRIDPTLAQLLLDLMRKGFTRSGGLSEQCNHRPWEARAGQPHTQRESLSSWYFLLALKAVYPLNKVAGGKTL